MFQALRIARPVAIVAVALLLGPVAASAQFRITTPGTYGDQLFFFFDARADRIPFLTVSNLAIDPIDVQIAYFTQDMAHVLAVDSLTLPPLGHRIIDPTAISSVKGNAGLAVVTPVGGEPTRPVVPPSQPNSGGIPPLFGSFTLANTKLGAGFGQNPLARIAVDGSDQRAAPGTVVDGTAAVYQSISPDMLVVPTFFDPGSLSPAEQDGNRIFLASFEDQYGPDGWRIVPKTALMDAFFNGADGSLILQTTVDVSGVRLDDLQSLAGSTHLTESGKLSLQFAGSIEPFHNVFGVFAQALGTYSIGQRMPGFELKPVL